MIARWFMPPLACLLPADAGFTGYEFIARVLGLPGGACSGVPTRHVPIRVGSNVRLPTELGHAEQRRGLVYLWPDAEQKRKRPPLVLRLVTLPDGRNRRAHLLTDLGSGSA